VRDSDVVITLQTVGFVVGEGVSGGRSAAGDCGGYLWAQ